MLEFPALHLIAPDAAIVGVIEEDTSTLPGERIDFLPEQPGGYILHHPLANASAFARFLGIKRLNDLRRAGAALVLITHDEPLLEQCADEIWWLRDGRLVSRGHPAETLPLYRKHVARMLRTAGAAAPASVNPADRSGDGRASLESLCLAGHDGRETSVWRSGENVSVAISFRYSAQVADPVVGMLIRTRIGLNVYGTNTELEQLHPGPVENGDLLRVTFRFTCALCPGDYTITAASHDPDGLWHDWLEDAAAFAVTDDRYTAGVANLRAQVSAELSRS